MIPKAALWPRNTGFKFPHVLKEYIKVCMNASIAADGCYFFGRLPSQMNSDCLPLRPLLQLVILQIFCY